MTSAPKRPRKMFEWGFIGAGQIAHTVARQLKASNRHHIAAVYCRTEKKASKFATKYNARAYTSLEDFLNDSKIQAVYIATPHSVHYPLIKKVILSGKPVFSEKAFTVNAAQAKEVATLAELNNIFLAEAMWTRFNPVTLGVMKWIKEGRIGEIKSFSSAFCYPLILFKPFVPKRIYRAKDAGGALLDLGVYPISYAQMLLGKPNLVECKSEFLGNVDFDDVVTLKYPSAVCKLQCSFKRLYSYKGIIEGTLGRIEIPMFYRPVKAFLYADGKKQKITGKAGYVHEFDRISEEIAAGKKQSDYISLADTVAVMEILDDCRAANNFVYSENIEKL